MRLELIVIGFRIAAVTGTPQISFPFNSQVPLVARVGQPYYFDISSSSFQTNNGPLTYSLSNAPAWLQIDSKNGSLFGTPSSTDAGAPQFNIVATDITGSTPMQAILVISTNPAPQLGPQGEIINTLADFGTRCGLNCVQVTPSTQVQFQFPLDAFVYPISPAYFYATLQDHTPLPSWLQFNSSVLAFYGNTPTIDVLSQRLDINLITSDVSGFAGVMAPFTLIVSEHQFQFDALFEIKDIPAGQIVNISGLRSDLYLDKSIISDSDYQSAIIESLSWLNFDPATLSIIGSPPPNATASINVTIDAHDRYNDAAFITIQLNIGVSPLYTGHIGMLNATIGKQFYYQLSKSDFTENDVNITVNLGIASQWLQFNTPTLTIQGTIPWNTTAQVIDANITITNDNGSIRDFQEFEINIGE
jgi:Putative Ig domain